MEDLNQEFLNNFKILEEDYKKFYCQDIKEIKIYYLYLNFNNEIIDIKIENEKIENNKLKKDRILYLIKKKQMRENIKYRLTGLLKYNIDLTCSQIKNFILEDKNNYEFLTILKMIETVYFNQSINMFENLNSIYILFSEKLKNETEKNTRKIHLRCNLSKSRGKK